MKLMWPPIMELWHILPVYIICHSDLDLWPIYTKIGSCDQTHMVNIFVCFEVDRPFRFWNILSESADFVAPFLGNRCCHSNCFLPISLGGGGRTNVSLNNEVDRTTRYWVKAYFSCIHYVPVLPWPLTNFPQNWVTWSGGCDECMCFIKFRL